MSKTMEYIAQRVKHLRTQQNLSLEELADKSNLTKNYIWQIEQAKANVSINKLEALSSALNVDLLELLPGTELEDNASTILLSKKINSLPEEKKELIHKILRLASKLEKQRDLHLVIGLLESMHQK